MTKKESDFLEDDFNFAIYDRLVDAVCNGWDNYRSDGTVMTNDTYLVKVAKSIKKLFIEEYGRKGIK